MWPAMLCSEGAMMPVFLGHVDLQDLTWCILDWTWEGGGRYSNICSHQFSSLISPYSGHVIILTACWYDGIVFF